MTRNHLFAALVATAACAGMSSSSRPTALRELPTTDIERCYQSSRNLGNQNLQGSIDLWQIVDEQGNVPAAFVHVAKGLDFPPFMSCLTDLATGSKYESQKVDYLRPNPIKCDSGAGHCQKQSIEQAGSAPLDERLAQATLTFAGWATATDKGWAYTYVHKYKDALAAFEDALKAKPDDTRALRGLAVALAESGGDLKRAREAAEKAVQLKPDSAATHEALLRVCLAQKDDKCALEEFDAARKAPDMQARSFELALVQDRVKAAADRLNLQASAEEEKSKKEAEAAMQAADPTGCRKLEPNSDAQLLCLIKRCFAEGAKQWANELKPLTGQDYRAGEWKVENRKGDNAEVTVAIRVPGAGGTPKAKGRTRVAAAEGPPPHDATWKVTVGDTIRMVAANLDAANIAKKYDACKK